jgi:hypothetical protein
MKMPGINEVLDAVRAVVGECYERGDEYRAKCPNHLGESNDSLSIRETDDGKILLCCHSNCSNEDIVDALGLEWSELFSKNGQARGKPIGPRPAENKEVGETLTVEDLPGEPSEYMVFQEEDGTPYYIQKHKGPGYRVVGFDEDGDPLLKAGLGDQEPILYGLPGLKEAIKDGEPVIHAEGCKEANTAKDRLGVAGVTSGSCTSWKSHFAPDYEGATAVWIIPDNDEKGRDFAHDVAQDLAGVVGMIKMIELPGLGEGEDLTDWLDAGHTKEEFFALVEATPPMRDSSPWHERPTSLEIRLPAVEEFEGEMLPEPLRDWVFDVARRMDNAAPDFTAAAAVVQAGALLGRKVGIYPKRHDDWLVIPNLWGGLVGPPSSMKTPALEQAIKPIKRLAALAKEAHLEAVKTHELDKMVAAAEKGALKKQLEDKAKAVASGGVPREELDTIREKIQGLEEPEEPVQRRYVTNDATIEKIAEILSVNPDGILYYSDELMRFLKGLDRVGREADRAFFLEAWNGNGSFEVDRISRGSIHIPALCISLLGGIQPGPLTKYVGDALAEAEKADGLLQRFQVLVYPDMKNYEPSDIQPNVKARNRAYDVMEKLSKLNAEEFGAHQEDDEVTGIRFSEDAQRVFDAWRSEVEPRYRTGKYPEAIESHMLKYRSLFASLALIFEAVDFVSGTSEGGEISEENALRAAGWCSYLETHVHRVYSPLMDTPDRRALVLLHHLEVGDIRHGAKVREIQRKGWPSLTTAQDLGEALDILESLGWVRRVTVKSPGKGRGSEQIYLHPELRD